MTQRGRETADRIPMDEYGQAAREYIRARSAAREAAFCLPHLKSGMSLLDCGCGEGTITVGLAQVVAPGEVVGIDIAPQSLEVAKATAAQHGVSNVRFEVASVYELPFADEAFDAVFSHALFEHLTDKPKALRELYRVLKRGGVVGLRSPDLSTRITEPPDELIEQYWTLYVRIREEMGGDANMGRRLFGLLEQAGFVGVDGSASLEAYASLEQRRWFARVHGGIALVSPYADEWLRRGWADKETLQQINRAWLAWAEQPGAFAAVAWCEAVGWKE